MNTDNIAQLLLTRASLSSLPAKYNKTSCLNVIDRLIDYIANPSEPLEIYTEVELEQQLFNLRQFDIEKHKEDQIIIEDLRRALQAEKSKSDLLDRSNSECRSLVASLQKEITMLSVSNHKHQRNSEISSSENIKLKREIEELKMSNKDLATFSYGKDRDLIVENSTLRSKIVSLERSSQDYEMAFKSTKKKLHLHKQRMSDITGYEDCQSPMGEDLDTTSIVWSEEGLSPKVYSGSLLTGTGDLIGTTMTMVAVEEQFTGLRLNLEDLSDAAWSA